MFFAFQLIRLLQLLYVMTNELQKNNPQVVSIT